MPSADTGILGWRRGGEQKIARENAFQTGTDRNLDKPKSFQVKGTLHAKWSAPSAARRKPEIDGESPAVQPERRPVDDLFKRTLLGTRGRRTRQTPSTTVIDLGPGRPHQRASPDMYSPGSTAQIGGSALG